MRNLLLICALALPLANYAQQPQVTIAKDLDHTPGIDPARLRDYKLWQALSTGDDSSFKANFSPSVVVDTEGRQQTRDQFFATFKGCKEGPLNVQNHHAQPAGEESVTTTYKLHLQMTCHKQLIERDYTITAVWVRVKQKNWFIERLTETPIVAQP